MLSPTLPLESLSVAAYKFPGKPLIRAGPLAACLSDDAATTKKLGLAPDSAAPLLLPFYGFLHTNASDLSPLNAEDTKGYMVLNHVVSDRHIVRPILSADICGVFSPIFKNVFFFCRDLQTDSSINVNFF